MGEFFFFFLKKVFIGGESKINVRPFYADKMIFRCLKSSDDNVLPVLLDVLGALTDKRKHYVINLCYLSSYQSTMIVISVMCFLKLTIIQ